jgi:uncharacterized protein (DUF488 family)
MPPEELGKLLAELHVAHVFDVRSATRQRVPIDFNPSNLSKLVSKFGADYYDESNALGDRPNYPLFTLSQDYRSSLQPVVEAAKDKNILVVCTENDYRKCHRRLIGSSLSRDGFLVRHLGRGLTLSFQSTLENIMHDHPLARRMFTIGFTRKSMREFAEFLRDARIKRVVDIRLRPVSQYSGFARKDDLEFLLELMKIEYIHTLELAPTNSMLDGYRSDNDWSKYERDFRTLLDERHPNALLEKLLTPGLNVAFLCTEDTPDRCHRRLVSEYAKKMFADLEIVHLTSGGSFQSNNFYYVNAPTRPTTNHLAAREDLTARKPVGGN